MRLRLYHYWRSSSSWRVRWALAFKNIPCEFVAINLLSDEAESEEHLKRNPLGFIPVLENLDHPSSPLRFLSESTAIIEYLEELHPTPSLYPADPLLKARTRQLAEIINSDTQPLQNMNTFLRHSSDPEEQKRWNQYWIQRGLIAYETLVQETAGIFSVRNSLTTADLFLIPQCYNAKRFDVPLSDFPTIERIYHSALETESYRKSAPEGFQPK